MTARFTLARAATLALGFALTIGSVRAQTVQFSETFEDGTLGAFSSSGTPAWSVSTYRAYLSTYSAHIPDVVGINDLRLTTTTGISIPEDICTATLSFMHWHQFDEAPYSSNAYDGGVLEISDDGGTTWEDAGDLFLDGGYNGQLNGGESNPLGTRYAWVLQSNGWDKVVADLSAYAGETIHIRMRQGTGQIVGAEGWYVDNVSVETTSLPTISVSLDRTMLWPPNHSMAAIAATITSSGESGAVVTLVSLTSNEADNGEDDGNTTEDIQFASIGTNDDAWSVRAERSGVGAGRVYTAVYRITNPSGCFAEATATVNVPLSNGSGKVVLNGQLLGSTALQQNMPNPFTSTTTIPFEVATAGAVSLTVFDAMGRTAATLVDREMPAGSHSAVLDASALTSGTYYYVLDLDGERTVRSMILSK